ncbi:MAG TPA: hypothetical protein VEB19_00340 [Gemmatimonadaceae bacterium]|nr:hypothetical protein [Gemmatimonadaceae bacterium]
MDTFMRWERLFQAACCGNCALSLGAMRLLTEPQKAAAIQRVFAVVDRVDSANLPLMQGFMDYAVKRFQVNEAPEIAIGAWLLQSVADAQPGSSQLRELASSSEMQRLHGTLVMNLTREWGRAFLAA